MSATILPFRQRLPSPVEGLSEEIAEARERVASLRAKRLVADRGERLAAPGCSEGCATCYRECAVVGIMLNWWEAELHRLTGGAGGTVH